MERITPKEKLLYSKTTFLYEGVKMGYSTRICAFVEQQRRLVVGVF
ncbi:hypothetical protein FHS68_002149 [Dyadobacter arcticus]|uniref:Uncharacterized protein n=1 Tax=Dyadobacter arcticus TaxID=1078754 RepID=A0ABX0ULM0_9BACT|nr:hypothetical protein [Dyadobacter arcticus]